MILDAAWNVVPGKDFRKAVKKREICVFGDSKNNTVIYEWIPAENIKCIFDNNKGKWGMHSHQVPIAQPAFHENALLLFAVADYNSLIPQLRELGYQQWYYFVDDEVYERKLSKAVKFLQDADSDFVWTDRKYKYIHVIPDQKFIYPLSVVLEHSFDMKEHAFLLYGFNESNPQDLYNMWDLYKRLSRKYGNIALAGSLYSSDRNIKQRLDVLGKKLETCEKIIFHGEWLNDWVFLFFKEKLLQVREKGCLIAWSGNFGNDAQNDKYVNDLLRECHLFVCRVNDEQLKKIYGKVKFPAYMKILRDGPSYSVPSKRPEKHHNKRPKVLIAHSCFSYNGVIEGLDLLKKYKGQIDIFCCGSYGDPAYIKKVKEYGQELYGEDFHFVDQYLEYDAYLAFINDMDAAFFAETLPGGATTIRMLAYAGKKIYLNKNVAEKFKDIGIKTYFLEQIKEEDGIDKFMINQFEAENYRAVKVYFDFHSNAELWEKVFSYNLDG